MSTETRIRIDSENDIIIARLQGREIASRLGFSGVDSTLVATAVSELARNIIEYAERGEVSFSITSHEGQRGVIIVASDDGPGIANIDQAMQDGYSSGAGLGLGLPGVRRLMDEFEIFSDVGRGTTVQVKKWRH